MNLILAAFDQAFIGQFHPVMIHVPMILFAAALVADIFNYFGQPRALYIGHWLVILGLISCIPTIFTGLSAADAFGPDDPLVIEHRTLGLSLGVFASLYAGLRISAMLWQMKLRPIYYLILSVLLVLLVSWTRDAGVAVAQKHIEQHSHQ